MKTLNLMILTGLCLIMALPCCVEAAEGFDWMPLEPGDQSFFADQIIPKIVITKTPKPTADLSKYTKTYVIELKKFNISNDGTNAIETSKGINAALQYAKTLKANRIIFPKGTYLISETDPVIIDHKNTIIDLNGATLQMRPNGVKRYGIVEFVDGAENARLTNGTLRGDKEEHDYSGKGGHESGHCLIFNGGNNLEADHLILANGTGDGANSREGGVKTKARRPSTEKVIYTVYPGDVEQGSFSDKGEKINSTEKIRTINAYDMTKCNGEFEFGYTHEYMGYPFVKGRVYQVYFYDDKMKFVKMEKCLQFRKVGVPKSAKFVHLEFNQAEVPAKPLHYVGGETENFLGRITNLRPPLNVHFHHNKLIGNRRLGFAYIGGKRWLIEDNLFEGNGGTSPGYGIDFEDGWELMQDVVIRNNRFKDNVDGDLVICAGSELLIEDNIFEKNVILKGRPHNYTFRNNTFTGGLVGYSTRTGVAKIHDNTYENCKVAITFDTKAIADGLNRKPGKAVATPPLTLENETMTNVDKVSGTYFNFKNVKLANTMLVAGDKTSMVHLENCVLKDVSLEYEAEGPDVYLKLKDCKGELKEQGPGMERKKAAQ